MGRPLEYDPRMLLKLVLLAYSYGIVSCRKIERFAQENIVAMWLTQEQRPTYRTIARFIVSKELTEMIQASFKDFYDYLQKGLMSQSLYLLLHYSYDLKFLAWSKTFWKTSSSHSGGNLFLYSKTVIFILRVARISSRLLQSVNLEFLTTNFLISFAR